MKIEVLFTPKVTTKLINSIGISGEFTFVV